MARRCGMAQRCGLPNRQVLVNPWVYVYAQYDPKEWMYYYY